MTDSERNQEKKRDSILRKMLNTPPTPHKAKKDKPDDKKKGSFDPSRLDK